MSGNNGPTRYRVVVLTVSKLGFKFMKILLSSLLIIVLVASASAQKLSLREVNKVARPPATSVIAIVGATLIDGTGGPVVTDSTVIIRGERIVAVGKRDVVKVPSDAEVVDAQGLTLVPGLIDSHFHIDGDDPLPA